MEPEQTIPLNLTSLDDDNGLLDCVVIRGFNPGVKTQFDAIVDTYLLQGAYALRFSSEVAALEHWHAVMTAGNQVAWLGSASIEERLAFRQVLCERLQTRGTILPTSNTLGLRTGSVQNAQPAPYRADFFSHRTPPPSPQAVHPPAPPPSPRHTRASGSRTSTQPPPDQHDANLAAAGVKSYAPPPHAGAGYRPARLPADYVCRGNRSQYPWYTAYLCRRPGIYCDWNHVLLAHGDCPRKRIAPGHQTYAEAIAQWVSLREAGEIRRYE